MKKVLAICISLFICIFGLLILLNSYSVEEAIENGDFITNPELKNMNNFNRFMADVNNHIDSKIRITEYSKEGVPKVNDLEYCDNIFILHSFYPNNIFNKKDETGEYTEVYFDSVGDDADMYLINSRSGTRIYICQIRNY
jgi:hypothetical protein